jgi:hypothetical protein
MYHEIWLKPAIVLLCVVGLVAFLILTFVETRRFRGVVTVKYRGPDIVMHSMGEPASMPSVTWSLSVVSDDGKREVEVQVDPATWHACEPGTCVEVVSTLFRSRVVRIIPHQPL